MGSDRSTAAFEAGRQDPLFPTRGKTGQDEDGSMQRKPTLSQLVADRRIRHTLLPSLCPRHQAQLSARQSLDPQQWTLPVEGTLLHLDNKPAAAAGLCDGSHVTSRGETISPDRQNRPMAGKGADWSG